MEKLSAQEVSQLLNESAQALRKVASERDEYKARFESAERRQSAEKLASQMHDKGLELDTSAADLADRLEKAAENGKFDVYAQAVELVGPNMGAKLGQLASDDSRQMGGSDLETFLLGRVG